MENVIESRKPFIGEASADVRLVVEHMKKVSPGDTVTYQELTRLIGRDVTVHRHICDSARRILLREHNAVFRAVMNEGFRRLEDSQVVDVVTVERKQRIRKQAASAIREISSVNYQRLDKDRQLRHNTGLAMFGALIQATGRASVKKLQERVANAGGKIDAKGTLKLIGWLGD